MSDETMTVRAFCKGFLAIAKEAARRPRPPGGATPDQAQAMTDNLVAAITAATQSDEIIMAFINRGLETDPRF